MDSSRFSRIAYDVTLLDGLAKHHDATTADGRRVQIKATMQRHLTFPCDHSPDYYLGIVIHRDGSFSEVFNGPGWVRSYDVNSTVQDRTTNCWAETV